MNEIKSIDPVPQQEAECILRYIKMIDFLSKILDKDDEIVLHSFRRNKESGNIIAIRNSYINGRKLGDGILAEGQSAITNNAFQYQSSVINYDVQAPNGNHLICSSMLIKDDAGRPIGLFSINKKVSEGELSEAERNNTAANMTSVFQSLGATEGYVPTEDFLTPQNNNGSINSSAKVSIKEQLKLAIKQVSGGSTNDPKRLSVDERISVITLLKKRGIFQLRNAVNVAADFFELSEPTIYRYLQKSQNEQTVEINQNKKSIIG